MPTATRSSSARATPARSAIVCIGESLAAAAIAPRARRRAPRLRLRHGRRASARRGGVRRRRAISTAIRALVARGAVAIGECGLDYHYDHSPRELQRRAFAAQLALARELDRPVVVHTREAEDDTRGDGRRGGSGRRARRAALLHRHRTRLAEIALAAGGTCRSAASSRSRNGTTTRSSASCPTIDSSSNRTRRISRPFRTAASGTSPPGLASPSRASRRPAASTPLDARRANAAPQQPARVASSTIPSLFERATFVSLKIVHTDKAPAAIGPYSQGIVANGFLFTAGQIAIDPATGQIVTGDVPRKPSASWRISPRCSPPSARRGRTS